MAEYDYYDGEGFITFNIVDVNIDKFTINVAVSNRGKISVIEYDLFEDYDGFYFEYGTTLARIHLDDFENITENENVFDNIECVF